MKEKAVYANVAESVKGVVKSVEKLNRRPESAQKREKDKSKEEYKGIVEAVLSGVATRIVLSHSYKELGDVLTETVNLVVSRGGDAKMLDRLKGRVIDVVNDIAVNKEGERIGEQLEALFKQGKYTEAAQLLKSLAEDSSTGLEDKEKVEIVDVLGKIKSESKMSPAGLAEVKTEGEKFQTENENVVKDIVDRSDRAQVEIQKEEIKVNWGDVGDQEEVATMIEINKDSSEQLSEQVRTKNNNLSRKDIKFIQVMIAGVGDDPRILDFEKMDKKAVRHYWYRTAAILENFKYKWDDAPQLKIFLESVNDAARRVQIDTAVKYEPLEGMTPSEARWAVLPEPEKKIVEENLGFIQRTKGDWRELLQYQQGRMRGGEREITTRTDVAMHQLFEEHPELENQFDHPSTGKWIWKGSEEGFFDICRREVYEIQGQLSQENMSQLVFEDSAQKYLALMRIDVKDDLELEAVKDAITKTLYIEFAVKTMWRSGGNIEAWQRAASVLTQDSEKNFFQLMGIGEMLKFTNKEGEEIEIGRYNWEDLMNLAEMKAENGQYYMTYMAGQSSALREERKPEFVAALADLIVQKKVLKGEMTTQEAKDYMLQVQGKGYKFSNRQVRSMVDYMQFLEVATFRGGEFGLNQSTVDGKFEFTDLPCGEAVQKTGPWSVIYDWYYPVTKYGGEWVGKIFLPNVNILSYARSETLGHLIAEESKVVAGMRDKNGNYVDTGVGAREFFFGGQSHMAVNSRGEAIMDWKGEKQLTEAGLFAEFWGDVIFDTRTGGISESQQRDSVKNKNSINRTVDQARKLGHEKFVLWQGQGKLEFVESLDFSNMEVMLGYEIPGATKLEKFEWMSKNVDYSFWRKDLLKSKRVGDWVNKYVPKKYEEARLKLMELLNAPGTATVGALRDIVSEYSDESGVNEMGQWIIQENRKFTAGRKWALMDNTVISEGTMGRGTRREGRFYAQINGREVEVKRMLAGYKDANRSKGKWQQAGSGDYWEFTQQWHPIMEGKHWGSRIPISRQSGKELFQDPMYFEKMEIDNQYHAGMISRAEWGQMKRDWQKKAYFGDEIEIGRIKLRLGYLPMLTPFFLARGWWVDRMQLDWEDFLIVLGKNNEEAWEKFKKVIGI